MKKTLFLLLLLIVINEAKSYGQPCSPVYHTAYDTLCSGDTLFGYYNTGVYIDTFNLGNGCDSIRILDLTIIPDIGTPPASSWFNTGTNGSGGPLPGGSSDLNWKVATAIDGAYAPAMVMTVLPGSYSPSIWTDCKWISHSAAGDHTGNMDYYYKINFDLPCADECGRSFDGDSTFCLGLDFMADNSVYEIYVNGMPQSGHLGGVIPVVDPYNYVGYQAANQVTVLLCKNWRKGENTLIIHIKSGSPYQGFLAQASINAPLPPVVKAGFDIKAGGGIDTASVVYGCAPMDITFVNRSVAADNYIWDFGDGSPATNLPDPAHTYNQPGTYTVSLFAANKCENDTVKKQIIVSPAFADTLTISVCEGATYSFNGTELSDAGIYPFKFTSSKGCDSIRNLNLIVHPLPPDGSVDIYSACRGQMNGYAVVVLSDTAVYSYFWKTSDGRLLSTKDTLAHVPGGEYLLEVKNSYGCSRTFPVLIPEEEVSFDMDTLVCSGDTVSLNNTSGAGMQYMWDFGDGNVSNLFQPLHRFDQPGVYTVMLVGKGTGCVDTAYKTITVDAPLKDFLFDMEPKEVCAGQPVYFYFNQNDERLSGLKWDFEGIMQPDMAHERVYQHAFSEAGHFPVTLTAQFRACPEQYYTDTVTVYPLPYVDLGSKNSLCLNSNVLYLQNREPEAEGVFRYLWNTGDTTKVLKVVHPGTYSLSVITAPGGCTTTESVVIKKDCYLDIPNAFTPNGDAQNDYFFPRQLLSKNITGFKMQIFNRWGQLIFQTTNIQGRGWDGKFNGVDQPNGVYVYLITAEIDGIKEEHYKGNVTLLR